MGLNVVISGPGGVGKGTIVRRLIEREPDLWVSRSWTTRTRRRGEAADAYHFTTRDDFDEHIEAGGFLEWVDFLDYKQGTPVPQPPAGADVLFEIDVHGARAIREWDPDALLLFIDAPSTDAQRARMIKRGDPPERVEQRLTKAVEERRIASELGMITVVNDVLSEAVATVHEHLESARAARGDRDQGSRGDYRRGSGPR